MQSDPSALQVAAKSPQAIVRARARAVLAAIGADTLPNAPGASPAGELTSAVAQPSQPEPDLMGDLLGPDEASAQPPQHAPAAAAELPAPSAAASGGDLLGALLVLAQAMTSAFFPQGICLTIADPGLEAVCCFEKMLVHMQSCWGAPTHSSSQHRLPSLLQQREAAAECLMAWTLRTPATAVWPTLRHSLRSSSRLRRTAAACSAALPWQVSVGAPILLSCSVSAAGWNTGRMDDQQHVAMDLMPLQTLQQR